ncbi:MAG: hypothetical protein J0L97_08235 [Alphaproteobacteria bacterium]|nr:hypothetical protein [Alphaproteobacteria bacterium]
MKRIALAVNGVPDDRNPMRPEEYVIRDTLVARGCDAAFVDWRAPVDWAAYDAVILRTLFGYYEAQEEYRAWLDAREKDGSKLFNPAPVVRWNMDKRYLRELEAAGFHLPPTAWVEQGEEASLAGILRQHGWEKVVVKPVISAGAWKTWVTDPVKADGEEAEFEELLAHSGAIIQPFLEEVVRDGEISLLFFGGTFSHSVLKRAKAGDFRIQDVHGGTYALYQEDMEMRRLAANILAEVEKLTGSSLLYGRVDGIVKEGRFLLMEVEVIEPFLYLVVEKAAMGRYVDAVLSSL